MNEITNVKAKFDILKGVHVTDEVKYKENKSELRDFLLDIKNRTTSLFIRVEQGLRKYKNDILIVTTA